ncbi:MAG: tRNA pseudouridine(38-40) synthase TruA [Anaerolineae bacterium]|jgi:tRNA pseudouridine38-40 synthase|nr:tRNA pseudouridine(38-40) synthase TruA [Anaerolineae bacterium]
MARYRAVVAYDGTNYAGFQKQGRRPTIQLVLEDTLARLCGQPIALSGAGRTDAGVHASGQVIAFDADWPHGDDALLKALNHYLPPEIAVQALRQQPGFHPRYQAHSRTYRYDVAVTAQRLPLLWRTTWQIMPPVDVAALQAAAALLVGEHDFATFGTPPRGDNTVRVVFASGWQAQPAAGGPLLSYRIQATAFLQHMVRRIVAMLVAVGRGRLPLTDFEVAFRQADLRQALPPAPPQGLFLESVQYED